MAILEADNESLDRLIDTEYAVVDCYGDFCAACVMLEPVYAGAANDMSFVRFIRINVSRYTEVAERYGVLGMPTLLFFRNGKVVDQAVGSIGRTQMDEHISKMLYQ